MFDDEDDFYWFYQQVTPKRRLKLRQKLYELLDDQNRLRLAELARRLAWLFTRPPVSFAALVAVVGFGLLAWFPLHRMTPVAAFGGALSLVYIFWPVSRWLVMRRM